MKIKRIMTSLCVTIITGVVLIGKVEAKPTTIRRISGHDRFKTAVEVSKEGWNQSNYAILSYGLNFPDALCATPLAKKYDCPILLTLKDSLNEDTRNELQRLKVKNVFITGGYNVISKNTESELRKMNINVKRLNGKNRYDTCVKIAEELGDIEEIFVVPDNSFFDALSVSSISAIRNSPIILSPKNNIDESVQKYLNKQKKDITTNIFATYDDINFKTRYQYPNLRYDTINEDKYARGITALNLFKNEMNFKDVYFTTGENYPDALTGSALASKKLSPMILLNKNDKSVKYYLDEKSLFIKNMNILGGEKALSNEIVTKCKPDKTQELELNKTYITKSKTTITVTKAEMKEDKDNIQYFIYYTMGNTRPEEEWIVGTTTVLFNDNKKSSQRTYFRKKSFEDKDSKCLHFTVPKKENRELLEFSYRDSLTGQVIRWDIENLKWNRK